jgi:hypothetical protein
VAPASEVALKALWHAIGEIGVHESGGPNRGPEVDEYLRTVGLEPALGSFPWCAAFVFWCFTRASADLKVPNPCPKTAGVQRMADKAAASRVQKPTVGAVFLKRDCSHCGFVVAVGPGTVVTVEGNTNTAGGREGVEVGVHVRPFHDIAGYLVF